MLSVPSWGGPSCSIFPARLSTSSIPSICYGPTTRDSFGFGISPCVYSPSGHHLVLPYRWKYFGFTRVKCRNSFSSHTVCKQALVVLCSIMLQLRSLCRAAAVPPQLPTHSKAYGLLLITMFILSGWQVGGRLIFMRGELNPLTFSLYRQGNTLLLPIPTIHMSGLAAAVLLCSIDRTFKLPLKADLPLLIYLGAATGASTVAFLIGRLGSSSMLQCMPPSIGLELSSALIASMLQPTVLVFAYALGVLRRTEAYSRRRVTGVVACVVAAVGAVISGEHIDGRCLPLSDLPLSECPDTHPVDWPVLLGGSLILIQCILTSSAIVLQRGLRHLSPPYLTGYSYLGGFIITLLLLLSWRGTCVALDLHCGVLTFGLTYSGSWTSQGCWLLLYAVLLATCFVYCAMNWCNRQTSPSVVASFMTLQPITTAIVQYCLQHEVPSFMQVVFFPFIVIGVALVSVPMDRLQDRLPEKATEMAPHLRDVEMGPAPAAAAVGDDDKNHQRRTNALE